MKRLPALVVGGLAAILVLSATPPTSATVPGSELLVDTVQRAAAPLAADAGDSAAVGAGDPAVLLGTAFGGTGAYSYAWSTTGGTLENPTNPTGVIDTTGLAPGDHTASLAVTDATGATSTDTVRFRVLAPPERVTLLDESRADTQPGVVALTSIDFPVDVPAGLARLEVTATWSIPANDYDLEVLDPSGAVAGSSGNAPPENIESVFVADPAAGTWTVRVTRFATAGDVEVRATVVGERSATGDPRPTVDAGGPYRFELGSPQQLDGSAGGGTGPLAVGWDTDLDGVIDTDGPNATIDLDPGRHLVTLFATDAAGFERREMTSVTVGTAEWLREWAVPLTVIGVADTGINPYHEEFSAATYPDPEVLEITRNFTRHPSEYLPGYPADAIALPITTGAGYYPAQDRYLWEASQSYVEGGEVYWIPGTKVIGAVDPEGSTGVTSGEDLHPILDDNGHGSGSASVSTGNRYGYCPTCLLFVVEALDETVAARYPFVDISTNSFGTLGGLPIGVVFGPDEAVRAAAERGQTILFAAGNGVGNTFFDVPVLTYGGSGSGPDWNVVVGAIREDNQEAIISDGVPVDISALGDGDLPSACRTGDTGQCAFGGTSAATPYTAGAFGMTLTRIRDALGDPLAGQRSASVVAEGTPIVGSPFLADGRLSRLELRAAVLKTAVSRGQPVGGGWEPPTWPGPWTMPAGTPASVLVEGYGSSGPAHAARAVEVLLGRRPLPDRPDEDEFFAADCENRVSIYGEWDRDGDGTADGCDLDESQAFAGIESGAPGADDPRVGTFDDHRSAIPPGPVLTAPFTYYLHRVPRQEPDIATVPCDEGYQEQFLSRANSTGDADPCFDSRATSTVAAFRPKGIFTATEQLGADLPAGSRVDVVVYVAADTAVMDITAVLKATDRELGRSPASRVTVTPTGAPEVCTLLGAACWTRVQLSFTTALPAVRGEPLTLHFEHFGAERWAYGYEGGHASTVTITAAAGGALREFGVTVDSVVLDGSQALASGRVAFPELGDDPQRAGFHEQLRVVQVALDPAFARSSYATVDPDAGTWTAVLSGFDPAAPVTVYARALRDRVPSPTASATAVPA